VPQRLDGGVRLPGAGRAPSGGERLTPCGPGALRMEGGYAALAAALDATLPAGTVRLGAEVTAVERIAPAGGGGAGGGGVRVTVEAKKVASVELMVGPLYKSNAVDPFSLKAPGFNP
jgi:hypothetical protein